MITNYRPPDSQPPLTTFFLLQTHYLGNLWFRLVCLSVLTLQVALSPFLFCRYVPTIGRTDLKTRSRIWVTRKSEMSKIHTQITAGLRRYLIDGHGWVICTSPPKISQIRYGSDPESTFKLPRNTVFFPVITNYKQTHSICCRSILCINWSSFVIRIQRSVL